MKKSPVNLIQSVCRALSIIELLSKEKMLGVTEISNYLGLHKSTVFGILSTLEHSGYVTQDRQTGKYQLSLKLFEIGSVVFENLDLRKIARPYLEELVKLHQETVHLVTLDKDEIIYIDKVESSKSIRISTQIGKRLPVHCTGVGKAMIAFKTEEDIEEIVKNKGLKPFTRNTITDLNELMVELRKIREQGYAIDNEEIEEGLKCVAGPIRDINGNVISAISISGPTGRMKDERIDEIIKSIRDASQAISRELGYRT